MDAATQAAIAADLATLVNPINILTDQPWTAAEMYEYTESLIAQKQGTGKEAISNRIADASANGYRPMSEGESRYLSGEYLHRAASAGLLRKLMSETNDALIALISLQSSLLVFRSSLLQMEGEFALTETIKDEQGNDTPNPEFVSAVAAHHSELAQLDTASNDHWKQLAQRFNGGAIADEKTLMIAVVNIVHTESALELFIESETDMKVDKRKTFENNKRELIELFTPSEIETELI
jgi:hypothetical protein